MRFVKFQCATRRIAVVSYAAQSSQFAHRCSLKQAIWVTIMHECTFAAIPISAPIASSNLLVSERRRFGALLRRGIDCKFKASRAGVTPVAAGPLAPRCLLQVQGLLCRSDAIQLQATGRGTGPPILGARIVYPDALLSASCAFKSP
mgnify:CR=1 FL=1